MGRWIEITGTSRADIKRKLIKMSGILFRFIGEDIKAERYAKPGSSIRIHKTKLEGIMKIPEESHLWWRKIKDRLGDIPGWVTPIKLTGKEPEYFDNDII